MTQMTLSRTTLIIMTQSITTLSTVIQPDGTRYKDIQPYGAQENSIQSDVICRNLAKYGERHYAECLHAECRGAKIEFGKP